MRLLNSVCKVLADNFPNVPVHIEQVPNDFARPCFLVEQTTDPAEIKSYHLYQNNPTFQIVYFGERDIAEQVLAEPLYTVQSTLVRLFLLALAMPVIPQEGERQRFAKIESFSNSLRLDEGAIYCSLKINFTDQVPHNEDYDLIEDVALNMRYDG